MLIKRYLVCSLLFKTQLSSNFPSIQVTLDPGISPIMDQESEPWTSALGPFNITWAANELCWLSTCCYQYKQKGTQAETSARGQTDQQGELFMPK